MSAIRVKHNVGKKFLLLLGEGGILKKSVEMVRNPIADDSHICSKFDTYEEAKNAYETFVESYVAKGEWIERGQ